MEMGMGIKTIEWQLYAEANTYVAAHRTFQKNATISRDMDNVPYTTVFLEPAAFRKIPPPLRILLSG
jgi:hypothetical protein